MTLNDIFIANCSQPSDINEHLAKLYEYGKKVSHITEFGVRNGISTSAFLASRPQKMISYDINYQDGIENLVTLSKQEGIDFKYIIENSNTVNIESTDLLFIDSEHTEENTLTELRNTLGKVSKYLIFHDSNYAEDRKLPRVRAAIDIFLQENKNWKILEEFGNNNGLLILGNINNI